DAVLIVFRARLLVRGAKIFRRRVAAHAEHRVGVELRLHVLLGLRGGRAQRLALRLLFARAPRDLFAVLGVLQLARPRLLLAQRLLPAIFFLELQLPPALRFLRAHLIHPLARRAAHRVGGGAPARRAQIAEVGHQRAALAARAARAPLFQQEERAAGERRHRE